MQFEGGAYYPAAIYLGGEDQTVVRAIDSAVIDLFNRAETSGNGGGNANGTIEQWNPSTGWSNPQATRSIAWAFADAVQAGRGAYRAGAMTAQDLAQPSTPVLGTPFWHQP